MKKSVEFEVVIGLEVHVQLSTKSKIFSSDENAFGKDPNNNLSAITIAHPGVLPLLNKEVVDKAIRLGLALECELSKYLIFDRKNYFYPDLPKGYQITQDTTPICIGGGLNIPLKNGESRFVSLTKIHMEEDAGKSIHVEGEDYTNIDLNRAGVPLLEIVTDPVIKSSEEAMSFLTEIRKIVRYLDISDGNMEEGSLRCDANVSIHKPGTPLGNKVEIKNMNSFKNVGRAIDHEIKRQLDLITSRKEVASETRTFNVETGGSSSMRTKEVLNDYRYFPEPDISPTVLDDEWIKGVRSEIPALPQELQRRLEEEFNLPIYDAGILVEDKAFVDYFIDTSKFTKDFKQISNWIIGPIKSFLNQEGISISHFPLPPEIIGDIIERVNDGEISKSAAAQSLFKFLLKNPHSTVAEAIETLDIRKEGNSDFILSLVNEILDANPDKVKAYHSGKKGLTGMFMGELMKKSSGKVDPKIANQLIVETLESRK